MSHCRRLGPGQKTLRATINTLTPILQAPSFLSRGSSLSEEPISGARVHCYHCVQGPTALAGAGVTIQESLHMVVHLIPDVLLTILQGAGGIRL